MLKPEIAARKKLRPEFKPKITSSIVNEKENSDNNITFKNNKYYSTKELDKSSKSMSPSNELTPSIVYPAPKVYSNDHDSMVKKLNPKVLPESSVTTVRTTYQATTNSSHIQPVTPLINNSKNSNLNLKIPNVAFQPVPSKDAICLPISNSTNSENLATTIKIEDQGAELHLDNKRPATTIQNGLKVSKKIKRETDVPAPKMKSSTVNHDHGYIGITRSQQQKVNENSPLQRDTFTHNVSVY